MVARAITKEVQEGRGSPHGGALLDIASRVPAETIKRKLPSMYHQFKELAEVDITKDPMEVAPNDPEGHLGEAIAPSGMPPYYKEISKEDARAITTYLLSMTAPNPECIYFFSPI